jgi:tRNA threonylcarbamoyladenosine biosynthesis protein TsaE
MKKVLNFEELNKLAVFFGENLEKGDVIALIGDLGTGKTSFVQKFAKALGVEENVKSPTFNYVLEYHSGRVPFYHFDVYRISEPMEIYELGYEEYMDGEGIAIIEWANLIESELPQEYIEINLYHYTEDSRQIEIKYIGNKKREEELLKNVGFSN